MTDAAQAIERVVQAVGIPGALGLIIALVIAYFYRHDFLLERELARTTYATLMSVVQKNSESTSTLSASVAALATALRDAEQQRAHTSVQVIAALRQRDG